MVTLLLHWTKWKFPKPWLETPKKTPLNSEFPLGNSGWSVAKRSWYGQQFPSTHMQKWCSRGIFFHRRHAMIIKRTRFFPRQLKTKIYTMDSICSTDCSSGQKMSVQVATMILSAQFLWKSCVLCQVCKSPQSLFVCFTTVYQITWTRMSVHDKKKI